MTDQTLTELDLSRLCAFVTLHSGQLPDVPQGVVATYRQLEKAGLATLIEEAVEIPNGCDVHNLMSIEARITQLGRDVADAMLEAGRAKCP